jgi:hypothetical protein
MKNVFVKTRRYGVMLVASAGAVAGSAHAAIDVSTVTSSISDAGTAIATVGAAFLAMMVGAKVYKWIKSAI